MELLWIKATLVVATISTHLHVASPAYDIYILGLFPMEGSWRGGRMALEAAELALQHINAREDVLRGYNLKLVWNNTKVSLTVNVPMYFIVIEWFTVKVVICMRWVTG